MMSRKDTKVYNYLLKTLATNTIAKRKLRAICPISLSFFIFPHVIVLTLSLASPNVPKALGFATRQQEPNNFTFLTPHSLRRLFQNTALPNLQKL